MAILLTDRLHMSNRCASLFNSGAALLLMMPAALLAQPECACLTSATEPIFNGANYPILALTTWDDDADATTPPSIGVGGQFHYFAGAQSFGAVAWDQTVWRALGYRVNSWVYAMADWDHDQDLLTPSLLVAAGSGISVVAWDGVQWLAVGQPIGGELYDLESLQGDAADVAGGTLVVAGTHFDDVNSAPIYVVSENQWGVVGGASVNDSPTEYPEIRCIRSWDADGPGGSPPVFAFGGRFDSVDGVPARNVAVWNGETWSALGSGLDGPVRTLVIWPSADSPGTFALVAGGDFSSPDAASQGNLAIWNGAQWQTLGAGVGGRVSSAVVLPGPNSISESPTLVVGGLFNRAGPVSARNIAAFAMGTWRRLSTGAPCEVRAMTAADIASVGNRPTAVFGGTCGYGSTLNATEFIAGWDGEVWRTLGGAGLNDYVQSIEVIPPMSAGQGDEPQVVVRGAFTTIGGVVAPGAAVYSGIEWLPFDEGDAARDDGNDDSPLPNRAESSGIREALVVSCPQRSPSKIDDVIEYDADGLGAIAPYELVVVPDLYTFSGLPDLFDLSDGSCRYWCRQAEALGSVITPINTGVFGEGRWVLMVAYIQWANPWNPILMRVWNSGLPAVSKQPKNARTRAGSRATLGAEFAQPDQWTFRWKRNGEPLVDGMSASGATISGALTQVLMIDSVTPSEEGDYILEAFGPCGSSLTQSATLTLVVHPCPGDADESGHVNFIDILTVLSNWGALAPTTNLIAGDADGNGVVNFFDILTICSNWGATCDAE